MEVNSPSISACMIVRNEEDNLPRCLTSLRGAVDDLIVVDTGSTDRTVEIAEQFGARVFHFPWCDDFAAARNASLGYAESDWIMWIDADDELVQSGPQALHELCAREPGPGWGYWLDVRSPYGQEGELEVTVRQWRLFRNRRGVHFQGRIHEEPWPPSPIHPDQIEAQTEVAVTHWGYVSAGEVLQQKTERNRRLLEMALEDEPDKAIHHFNLGRQLIREGDFAGGLRVLDRASELWLAQGRPPWAFAHAIFSFAALAALRAGQPEKAVEIESRCPAELVSSELLCHAGEASWRLGRRPEAIARLERAWQDPTVVNAHLHDESSATWQPLLMLAGLYDQTDEPARAYDRAQRAVGFAPQHPELLVALAYLSGKLSRPRDEQADWLRRLLAGSRDDGFKEQGRALMLQLASNEDDPLLVIEALAGPAKGVSDSQAGTLRAAAYGRLGQRDKQVEELTNGLALFPAESALRLALAQVHQEGGDNAQALAVLAGGLDQPNAPAELYQRLGLLLAESGKPADAANALEIAARITAGERPLVSA